MSLADRVDDDVFEHTVTGGELAELRAGEASIIDNGAPADEPIVADDAVSTIAMVPDRHVRARERTDRRHRYFGFSKYGGMVDDRRPPRAADRLVVPGERRPLLGAARPLDL